MSTTTDPIIELKGGRTVSVVVEETGEAVEIRAPGGAVELRIRMTPDGPVVRLEGQQVEIVAADEIALCCRKFRVKASEEFDVESAGTMAIRSKGQMDIATDDECIVKGKMIRLN